MKLLADDLSLLFLQLGASWWLKGWEREHAWTWSRPSWQGWRSRSWKKGWSWEVSWAAWQGTGDLSRRGYANMISESASLISTFSQNMLLACLYRSFLSLALPWIFHFAVLINFILFEPRWNLVRGWMIKLVDFEACQFIWIEVVFANYFTSFLVELVFSKVLVELLASLHWFGA